MGSSLRNGGFVNRTFLKNLRFVNWGFGLLQGDRGAEWLGMPLMNFPASEVDDDNESVDAIKFTHDFGQRMKAPSQGSLVNAATEFDDASQAKLVKTARIN